MRDCHGFTVVEMAVVITIMAILLVLGVGSYVNSQANARDNERKTTANNIAQALERYYRTGNGTSYPAGDYPAADASPSSTFLSSVLPGLDRNSFNYSFNSTAPSAFFTIFTTDNPPQETISSAVNTATTTTNIVYQPLTLSGGAWAPCTASAQECRRFKLYYRTEIGNTVQIIESRAQ